MQRFFCLLKTILHKPGRHGRHGLSRRIRRRSQAFKTGVKVVSPAIAIGCADEGSASFKHRRKSRRRKAFMMRFLRQRILCSSKIARNEDIGIFTKPSIFGAAGKRMWPTDVI